MSADKKNLLLLYDRPREPSFMVKGDGKQIFDVPPNLLPEEYQPLAVDLANRFGDTATDRIPVTPITPPDLTEILTLKRDDAFSLFLPRHRLLSGRLIELLLAAPDVDALQSLALYARDRVNPYLFNYALTVALLHRADTQSLDLPSLIHVFPDKFVDGKVFAKAREQATVVPEGSRTPIEVPMDYTASDLDREHRIAYWREDIGLNLHHWHWHLVYPFTGPRNLVAKDRRGELFYYMHQQIIARYNFERFSNELPRVTRLVNYREPVKEGYFPKLNSLVASRTWPARADNMTPKDVDRQLDGVKLSLDNMDRWRDRIYEAINSGSYLNEKNEQVQFGEFDGIDVLGNIIEAANISPNMNYYGDFHNMGHVLLGYIHDPDNRHLEYFGVMADPAVDLRDPIFFRWHALIDDIFTDFKATLPRYTEAQLSYSGVSVDNVQVQSGQGGRSNELRTFWQQSDLDLSRGMDFQPRGAVFVRFTHLQHEPFTYTITATNNGAPRMGTVRIFLAPKFDEARRPWLFRTQKDMFVEMDRFTVSLKQGSNTIKRESTQSSLTIPFERTFRDLESGRPTGGDALEQFNFCGCGWPQHVLLPKGNAAGFPCQLFVMISNYENDRVEQNVDEVQCKSGDTFCGIKDRLYPDRRSMGFPFDRVPRDGADTLQAFLTGNMRVQDVTIKFNNRIIRPKAKN